MLSKEEIISITRKELGRKPIGYEYYKDKKVIVPMFDVQEDEHDVPTMGGCWFIDENTKKMDIMSFLDSISYDGKIESVLF